MHMMDSGQDFLCEQQRDEASVNLLSSELEAQKTLPAQPPRRTYSGQRFYSPGNQAWSNLKRKSQSDVKPSGHIAEKSSSHDSTEPSAKRGNLACGVAATSTAALAGESDMQSVVVSFSSVGGDYALTGTGKDLDKVDRAFDWEGVRRCVRYLRCERGMNVVGVVLENWRGQDRGTSSSALPEDIKAMCSAILETPRLTGERHKVAETEMTIKCAWRRNCRFIAREDIQWEMRNEKCRQWLLSKQDLLRMRCSFEPPLGQFRVLE